MTRYFLRQGNLIKAMAAEPDPAEVDALRHHLQLNGFSKDACEIVNCPVGRGEGMVPLRTCIAPCKGGAFSKSMWMVPRSRSSRAQQIFSARQMLPS
jgi:hypothetical protein